MNIDEIKEYYIDMWKQKLEELNELNKIYTKFKLNISFILKKNKTAAR